MVVNLSICEYLHRSYNHQVSLTEACERPAVSWIGPFFLVGKLWEVPLVLRPGLHSVGVITSVTQVSDAIRDRRPFETIKEDRRAIRLGVAAAVASSDVNLGGILPRCYRMSALSASASKSIVTGNNYSRVKTEYFMAFVKIGRNWNSIIRYSTIANC